MTSHILFTVLLLLFFSTTTSGQRRRKPQVTKTKTEIRTITETKTKTTSTHCASFITLESEILTTCRRRRQYWIDVPVFLAVDEQFDQQLSQYFAHPPEKFQVETTIPAEEGHAHSGWMSDLFRSSSPISSMSSYSIQPSIQENDFKPIFFGELDDMARRMFGRRRKVTFVTNTFTTTSTTTKTSTTTATFFLTGCVPSPFSYSFCSWIARHANTSLSRWRCYMLFIFANCWFLNVRLAKRDFTCHIFRKLFKNDRFLLSVIPLIYENVQWLEFYVQFLKLNAI